MTFALQAFRATPEASSTQNTRLRRAKAVEASPQYVQDLLSRMHPVWDRILASGSCPRTGFLTLMQILADEIFNCETLYSIHLGRLQIFSNQFMSVGEVFFLLGKQKDSLKP